jgi:hypothetical protein
MSSRYRVLDAARDAVRDREGQYGSPGANMTRAAALATVMLAGKLKRELSAADMINIHLSIKMARLCETPNSHDTQVDLAGYASLMSEVV